MTNIKALVSVLNFNALLHSEECSIMCSRRMSCPSCKEVVYEHVDEDSVGFNDFPHLSNCALKQLADMSGA